ncbi:flagellin N-terminal helical domain-containing protein [Inhella gelatinilytica]|uniref:Flagellin n=1 Tax=Inhella gelatinilytica TaxID=2795030 RepID=A0A931NDL9_9BURK|nr:flagellin [Inhella gelatinilytica]MBH9552754.1 flagellin FliC [Inhella gelatinilytica]
MPQIINTNIASLNAQRNLNMSQSSLMTATQRLSSGLRVNSAKDDAAGMAIAERMYAQARGMAVAIRNANDGISLAQVAEGALAKVTENLQRMRELTVQARNATNSDSDKDSLDKEFGELAKEIQRIVQGTTFNGKAILAQAAGTQIFQIGANTTANDTIDFTTTDLSVNGTVTTVAGTDNQGNGRMIIGAAADNGMLAGVINGIDSALDLINSERATLGAQQNRFEAVIANLQIAHENQMAARSRIMDADYAQETSNLSRANILQQAGTAMVAQANQLPQQVLQLLRG